MLYDVQINDRGQITIPKELRDTVNFKAYDKLRLSTDVNDRIIVYKPNIFDDVEDLIRKDLIKEGLSSEQIEKRLPEYKGELGKALLKMAAEVDEEIGRGDYVTLANFNKELNCED